MTYRSRLTTVICLTAALLLPIAAPASADPIADKKDEAAAVQVKIAALQDKAEVATERFDLARERFNHVAADEHAAATEIDQLKARTKRLQKRLDTRASALYRQGPLNSLALLLSADSLQQLILTYESLAQMSRKDAATIEQLKETKTRAVAAHKKLVSAKAEADHQQADMAANEREVRDTLAEQERVLSSLNAEVKQLIAEQKAREEAAARARLAALRARQAAEAARAAARVSRSPGGGRDSFDIGGNPPASGRGAKAVWWAEQALGRPYVWAAAGPRSFDCSGLMLWAYRHVGVNLPHHSGSQIGRGRRVSRENLQPGDLVFFGSPIHHVAMYVGGGDIIEAPYSGASVRISSLGRRSDYAGASRP